MKRRIVTFTCGKAIHIYPSNCSVNPMSPCDFHPSIDKARESLKRRGIKSPTIITNK